MEEIRRSPVEVGSFFHYKVLYIPGGAGFLPSGMVRTYILHLESKHFFVLRYGGNLQSK